MRAEEEERMEGWSVGAGHWSPPKLFGAVRLQSEPGRVADALFVWILPVLLASLSALNFSLVLIRSVFRA